jgi:superfamily II DNA or RNA helicase
MKAVLSNRIFLEYTPELLDEIRQKFTYTIPSKMKGILPEVIQTYNKVSPKVVSIPAGAIDFIPAHYEIIDKRVAPEAWWPDNDIKLRPSQQEVCDTIDSSCLINAKVSWGKTFTALAIGAKLGLKTLVVVHTGVLKDQWITEAKKMFGESPSVMGGGVADWSKWLTIATVQTLTKHIDQLKDEFGCLIIDECHHIPSNTFKNVLDKIAAKYKIGLSGTLIRKDGKHVIFNDYFGKVRFIPPSENSETPEVYRIFPDVWLNPPDARTGDAYASMVTKLAKDPKYVDCVLQLAIAMAAKGHRVLVVSERTELLEKCYEALPDHSVLVTGATKQSDRVDRMHQIFTGERSTLFGALNIFSEGVSINPLSCLILACQLNNEPLLEQLIGRVTRVYPGKLMPVIIDINLRGTLAIGGIRTRLGHYITKGYKIHNAQKSY